MTARYAVAQHVPSRELEPYPKAGSRPRKSEEHKAGRKDRPGVPKGRRTSAQKDREICLFRPQAYAAAHGLTARYAVAQHVPSRELEPYPKAGSRPRKSEEHKAGRERSAESRRQPQSNAEEDGVKQVDITISILIIRPVRTGRDELFDLAEHIAEGRNTFGAASGFGRWGPSEFGRIVRESGRRIAYMLKDKN